MTEKPDPYQWWKDARAGKNPPIVNEQPQMGFFRRKIKRGETYVWEPVAIFPGKRPGTMAGLQGDRDLPIAELKENWHWFAPNHVDEAVWRDVAENGKDWPDLDGTVANQLNEAANADESPKARIKRQIAELKAKLPLYRKIESDDVMAQGQSLRAQLQALAGTADKTRDSLMRPHKEKVDEVNAEWMPLVKEAKALADEVRDALEQWETDKRKAAREAAQRAEAEAARIRAAAERAAAEAAKKGKPPPPAAVVEPPKPQSNLPPPTDQIKGGSGRAAHVGTVKVVTIIDQDAVYKHFRERPELVEWLKTAAERAVNAGITVPGVEVDERAKIR